MKRHTLVRVLSIFIATSGILGTATAGEILSTPGSLFRLDSRPGYSAMLEYRVAGRGMVDGETLLVFDTRRLVAGGGVSIADFLHVSAEVGCGKAELETTEGEWGLAYGIGVTASIYEHAVRSSPTLPRKESIVVSVDGDYRSLESNFGDMAFDQGECLIVPKMTYVLDLSAASVPNPKAPTGVTASLGLAFSQISAKYGKARLHQNRDFGVQIAASARLANDWLLAGEWLYYGRGDDELAGGLLYNF